MGFRFRFLIGILIFDWDWDFHNFSEVDVSLICLVQGTFDNGIFGQLLKKFLAVQGVGKRQCLFWQTNALNESILPRLLVLELLFLIIIKIS